MRDRTLKPVENVIVRGVGEEMVLLDMNRGGTYYGLDPVGARIWELLAAGSSLAQIADRLVEEYDVTREALEADVEKLVAELEERRLVTER
jgi:Coenzyme PQQ synthesis protein D (PqqD)